MKSKYIYGILLIFILAIISGCFNVERNNPYDPDADIPEDQKLSKVNLQGTVYRGWSAETIPDTQINLNGRTTYSDTFGNYYFEDLEPGNYTLQVHADGFIDQNYDIQVGSNKNNTTQTEDISMFIWYEYWEYNVGQPPFDPPWNFWVSSSSPAFVTGEVEVVNVGH